MIGRRHAAVWLLLSYVPLTPQWRRWRRVTRWRVESDALMRMVLPDLPPTPEFIRHPDVIDFGVQTIEAILRGITAGANGATGSEAAAVLMEHTP